MQQPSRKTTLLNHEELANIPLGEQLAQDYFYVPHIYFEFTDEWDESYLTPLIFTENDGNDSQESYASKVPAGMTLWQAVRADLEADFNYPKDKSFRIDDVMLLDTAKNRHGDELTRVLVEVVVDVKFDTNSVHPTGLAVSWGEPESKTPSIATTTGSVPTRDEVIAAIKEALKIVPPEVVKSPTNIYGYAYTDKIPEFEKADRMYDAWEESIKNELDWGGSSEASIEFRFYEQTIFWDAGFNADKNYLDELANDWLVNDEDSAREQGFIELADRIKQKMDEINKRVDELTAK